MQVIIDQVVSTVRAVDDRSLLSKETLKTIVDTVLRAVDERERHKRRLDDELRLDQSGRGPRRR